MTSGQQGRSSSVVQLDKSKSFDHLPEIQWLHNFDFWRISISGLYGTSIHHSRSLKTFSGPCFHDCRRLVKMVVESGYPLSGQAVSDICSECEVMVG
jgi:hypothetical protein